MHLSSGEADIVRYLNENNIAFEEIIHSAVMTVEESLRVGAHENSEPLKTLFITNKKHTKFFMIVMIGKKRLDLKGLSSKLDESKLTFASKTELEEILRTYQGAVSPFGLIFAKNSSVVRLIVDQDISRLTYLGFHPNNNTKTLELNKQNFNEFLETLDIKAQYMDI